MLKSRYAKQIVQERSCTKAIPYSCHVSDDTLITKEGDFIRTWKVEGIAFETKDVDDVILRKEQLNTLFRSLASNHIAIWTHSIRRFTSDRLDAQFENDFCQRLNDKYYNSFDEYQMMANELYITLVYRPSPDWLSKRANKASRRKPRDILDGYKAHLQKVDEISQTLEAGLKNYHIDSLTMYEENNIVYSQLLTFLNFLISGEWQKVRVPSAPLYNYLGNAWIFAGAETIEIRSPTRQRYTQGIDFKDYTAHTEAGLLNALMYEDYEYVMTQSFSFMPRYDGKKFLERQQKQLLNTEDGSATQIQEMSEAIDQLMQGMFAMGEYHYSLFVFGDSIEAVRKNRTKAMAIIQDMGFIASLMNTANEAGFFAQLPANWSYRPRIAGITTRNFAGLSCLHNFTTGKRDGNPWGQAVSLLKTTSRQPFYFNFHYTRDDEDNFDDKVLGNTRIIGQSGAGKTVLMTFLLCQSQKYHHKARYTAIFFDKDRGAELAVRRLNGKYLAVSNGVSTGFNPFQMDATENNILFLEAFVQYLVCLQGAITASDTIRISQAINTVMKMPKEYRRLSVLIQNITEGTTREEKENSINKRLASWCVDDGNGRKGNLWWVFDNDNDQIDFSTHPVYGFDGTDFLDNEAVRTPISMYLLHRMEQAIDGRRFIYFMDEAWKWVDDPAFAEFAGNKQLTIRKQNGLGVFATQMPSSLLKSKIASELVQQCATEIYLPNPKADYREYTEGFKVTEAEFEIIRNLGEDSRLFLIKQGHNSAIAQLNLAGMSEELAILSGSSDNIELLDSIIEDIGTDDPSQWEPIFQERLKARKKVQQADDQQTTAQAQ